MEWIILVLILIVVGVVLSRFVFQKKSLKHGEILPAGEMKEKYSLTAENRPTIELNSQNVPAKLRDLIPMAEKWGVGDDIIRDDIEERASEAEKKEFRDTLRGRTSDVSEWLDSFEQSEMSEEAAHFMYMLSALDESGLWPDLIRQITPNFSRRLRRG